MIKELRWLIEEAAELSETAQQGIADHLRILIGTWRKIDAKIKLAEARENEAPPRTKSLSR
jgi:hypothetical protein